MITLKQMQELRGRVDALRLSLLDLREENANLNRKCKELEARMQGYQQDEEQIQSEFNDMVEDLAEDSVEPTSCDGSNQDTSSCEQHYVHSD